MSAFVMQSIGEVGFLDKPVPTPGPNDAIVKTTRALICTSDSHTVRGAIGPRRMLGTFAVAHPLLSHYAWRDASSAASASLMSVSNKVSLNPVPVPKRPS